jgi:hypothetical protein
MLQLHPQVSVLAAGHYLHWGVFQVSLANLLIVGSVVVLFVLALVVRFPSDDDPAPAQAEKRAD